MRSQANLFLEIKFATLQLKIVVGVFSIAAGDEILNT